MNPAEKEGGAVRLENLTVSFFHRAVIRDLSATFARGELSVLLGRSGSGKTTLLRSVNRLNECFDGCRTTGRVAVRLGGRWREAYGADMVPEELRRRVGMVFQTPNVLPVSVARNLAMPLKLTLRLGRREIGERMERALGEAGLWDEVKDRLDDDARTLSGGQQQRLCLARVLALDPEILLLDEPSASLDFQATDRIEELLLDLKTRYTLIVVSHSLGQARRLADRLFIIRDGELVRALGPGDMAGRAAFHRTVEGLF